jgi:hypothetical protein
METYKFYIPEDEPNKIITPGISHGYGVGNKVDLLHKNGKYMVVKFPGASDWAGRFSTPEYFKTEYLFVKIIDRNGLIAEHFEVIERKEPGRFWKKLKTEYINRCNELSKF